MERKNSISDPDYQRNADIVAYYMTEANQGIMERLEKEDPEMTADVMKMREREIRAQERVESDRKIAEIAKNQIAALGLTVTEVLKSMGLSPEDQARIKQYM